MTKLKDIPGIGRTLSILHEFINTRGIIPEGDSDIDTGEVLSAVLESGFTAYSCSCIPGNYVIEFFCEGYTDKDMSADFRYGSVFLLNISFFISGHGSLSLSMPAPGFLPWHTYFSGDGFITAYSSGDEDADTDPCEERGILTYPELSELLSSL